MATPILTSFTDNSTKDGTNTPILGSEVDANPEILANILDGTTQTDLGGADRIDVLFSTDHAGSRNEAFRLLCTDVAAGSVKEALRFEWDPSDGSNLTDNSSGIGINWLMPGDDDTQDEFAAFDVLCVSDVAGAERGGFSWRLAAGGGSSVEVMTLESGLTTTGTILNLSTSETTVVDGDVLGRIEFQAPLETGADAILVAAAIWAEADATFDATTNTTDLVFANGTSEAATAKLRLTPTALTPHSNDLIALGTTALGWSDLHLATGGVINWANGEVTVTETDANTLTLAGATTLDLGAVATLDFDGAVAVTTGAGALTLTPATNLIIDNTGYVQIGAANPSNYPLWASKANANEQLAYFRNSSATTPYGLTIQFSAAADDNNTTSFLQCSDSGASRLTIYSDGDVVNHDGTYGTISDSTLKQDIVDAPRAWTNIKGLRFREYRMKADVANGDLEVRHGLVAQEVETVLPEFVHEMKNPDGTTTKWVDDMGLLKRTVSVLPELMARVEALEAP